MYKIGDRVIYQGADKDAYKRVGTLKSIEEKDGKPQLTVEFDGGETFTAPVDDWSREFTNACKNAVSITSDTRKQDNWVQGKVGKFSFEAKVFDEGSPYGIKGGRVSKLWIRSGDEIVSYERGWDSRPKTPEAKAAYTEVMAKLENLPKVFNSCACKNAKFKVGDKVEVHTTSGGEINAPRKIKGTVTKLDNGYGKVVVGYRDPWGYEQEVFCNPSEIVKVFSNSCACKNAKFKVGDKVIWKGRFGTVRGVIERPTLSPGAYYIKLTDNVYLTPKQRIVTHSAPESELTLDNSVRHPVRNFKTGEKVRIKSTIRHNGMVIPAGTELEVIDKSPGMTGDKSPTLFRWRVNGSIEEDAIPTYLVDDAAIGYNSVRSRNAVVAKALNACGTARNADVNKNFGFARILAYKDGGLGTRFVVSWDYDRLGVVYGGSWNDDGKKAVAETKANISKFEKLIADLKQAAAWLDQNGSKIEV